MLVVLKVWAIDPLDDQRKIMEPKPAKKFVALLLMLDENCKILHGTSYCFKTYKLKCFNI